MKGYKHLDKKPVSVENAGRSEFAQLLAIILPHGRGLLCMLQAYYDESGTHAGSPILCVAGFMFTADQCLAFEKEWAAALDASGIKVFHTVDYAHSKGEFASKGRRPEYDDLYKTLLGLALKHTAKGTAYLVSETIFNRVKPPGYTERWGNAYAVCALLCIAEFGRWCHKNHPTEKIAHVFESGVANAGSAGRLMNLISQYQELRETYCHYSHTFVSKKDAIPLQVADILAYEIYKEEFAKRQGPGRRPVRKSLLSLAPAIQSVHIPTEKKIKPYLEMLMRF
jgi:Protein of unknown function (DUF3800)